MLGMLGVLARLPRHSRTAPASASAEHAAGSSRKGGSAKIKLELNKRLVGLGPCR